MSKELIMIAKTVSDQKGIEQEVVLEAIQAALESATRKRAGKDIGVRVELDRQTGDYETFRSWEVCADDEEAAQERPDYYMLLSVAEARQKGVAIAEHIEEPMESVEFGRIAAQVAKQVIMQKVREAERRLVVNEYQAQIGTLITGTVKKVTRDYVILDLGGKAEALLSRNEMLPNEGFRMNDRVRAYLYQVETQARGPQLSVSRTHTNVLIELFKIEVPEIGEGIIEIKGAARDPGYRAKIAVKTNDGRIDPIGACVGMRGARVQAVSSELGGERIDIMQWDDNPAQLVINAMAPSDINSIVVDEDSHAMDLAVSEDALSQAIGRNGQNVRLASELTGWVLNVMADEAFAEKGEQELQTVLTLFMERLKVDEETAEMLTDAGFSSLEELAYVPREELLEIECLEEDMVDDLRQRANNALLAQALDDGGQQVEPAQDLLEMEGMDKDLAYTLASKGMVTREDLAEQAVDDLLEVDGMTKERAAELIMKAREPWFND